MNTILKNCGDEFKLLLDRWNAMEPGDDRDRFCEMLSERAEAIRLMPAADLADISAKASAIAWLADVDFAPPTEDDYIAFIVAGFIREVAQVGAAQCVAG